MSSPHISPAVVFVVIAVFLIVFGAACILLCRHVFHFQRENYARCGGKPCPGFARSCQEKQRIATTTRCPSTLPSSPVLESPALGFVSDEKFFPATPARSNSDLERLLPSVAPRLLSLNHNGGGGQPDPDSPTTISTTLLHQEKGKEEREEFLSTSLLPPPVTQATPSKPRKSLFLNIFSSKSKQSATTNDMSTASTLIEGSSPNSPTESVRVSVTIAMPQSPSSAHCRSLSLTGSGGGRIATRTPLPLYATQSR